MMGQARIKKKRCLQKEKRLRLHESKGWMDTVKVNWSHWHRGSRRRSVQARVRGVTRGRRARLCQSQLRRRLGSVSSECCPLAVPPTIKSLLLTPSLVPMATRPSRPLPVPPGPVNPLGSPYHNIYSLSNPYLNPLPRPPYTAVPVDDQPPAATLRGGTLLHKGFYDLLTLIPTPSPSRFLWGANADPTPDAVAGPRYEDLPDSNPVPPIKSTPPSVSLPSSGPVLPKKGRRISKDMVSKPMGFVYVCDHCASPALSLNLSQPFSACI